jgi:hypothetical protein
MIKAIAGVLAASVLMMVLNFTGTAPSLESPLLLGELCGVFALGALAVAMIGLEDENADAERPGERVAARVSARAAQRPQWPNM